MRSDSVTLGYLPVGHDPSLTIVGDSGVIAVAEEERYSGVKRGRFITDPTWVFEVLEEFGISPNRVRCLAVPNIVSLQELRSPASMEASPRFGQPRVAASLVSRVVSGLPSLERVDQHRHHRCHAASAYLASPFKEAAVVTVDGMGELETATISHGRGSSLMQLEAIGLPHSLGYVYQSLAWWSGLTGGEREGKFMGLASWGEPRLVDLVRQRFLAVGRDGLFVVPADLAALPVTSSAWNAYTAGVLGPRRAGDAEHPDPYAADVAASIQVVLEEALLAYCGRAQAATGSTQLCLAGGVFMNTVANGAIRRSGLFADVFVQPLASDNGLSLGAALLSHQHTSQPASRWVMRSAALGSRLEVPGSTREDASELVEAVVNRLLDGDVVGWVQGRAEVGARALGQRSVLADARDPDVGSRINDQLKRRERWRPFAPVVLEEDALTWGIRGASPFMTFVDVVPAAVRKAFPAVVHVDGTARIQTVSPAGDPLLRQLLLRVRERIGVGLLLNTSLNGPGTPIVRTRAQALQLLHSSQLTCMVIGHEIFEGRSHRTPAVAHQCSRAAIETLVELVRPESADCIELHATHVQQVRLMAASDAHLESGEIPALPGTGVITVLVPTWLDLVAELAPRLVRWLVEWELQLGRPVHVIDARGTQQPLHAIVSSIRPGLGGSASEVEHHWLNGVARWTD